MNKIVNILLIGYFNWYCGFLFIRYIKILDFLPDICLIMGSGYDFNYAVIYPLLVITLGQANIFSFLTKTSYNRTVSQSKLLLLCSSYPRFSSVSFLFFFNEEPLRESITYCCFIFLFFPVLLYILKYQTHRG